MFGVISYDHLCSDSIIVRKTISITVNLKPIKYSSRCNVLVDKSDIEEQTVNNTGCSSFSTKYLKNEK